MLERMANKNESCRNDSSPAAVDVSALAPRISAGRAGGAAARGRSRTKRAPCPVRDGHRGAGRAAGRRLRAGVTEITGRLSGRRLAAPHAAATSRREIAAVVDAPTPTRAPRRRGHRLSRRGRVRRVRAKPCAAPSGCSKRGFGAVVLDRCSIDRRGGESIRCAWPQSDRERHGAGAVAPSMRAGPSPRSALEARDARSLRDARPA
jgi:hypothetical protein